MRMPLALAVAVALFLLGSGPNSRLELLATPPTTLADAPVAIRVKAAPGQRVTISLRTQVFGRRFGSSATFVADRAGTVDASRDPPISGSYGGADGMGLFWSLTPAAPHARAGHGSHTFDYLAPRLFTVHASTAAAVSDKKLTRLVILPGIRFVDVKTAQLQARFYVHRDGRKHPTVIVVGGAEGGLPEDRPALIASHGFNTLALAYFGVDGLPRALANVPVERVQAAITWLRGRPEVGDAHIGIVGGSKGAEYALVAASHLAQLKAVVAFAPSCVVYAGLFFSREKGPAPSSWSYGGTPLPYVDGSVPASIVSKISSDIRARRPVSYAPEYLAQLQHARNLAAATIAVERINGPVLLVSGDDDRLWPSSFMARRVLMRLRANRHPFADAWLHYADAGHAVGERYAIYSDSTLAHSRRYDLALGGSPRANESASADAWPRVIAFLTAQLGRN